MPPAPPASAAALIDRIRKAVDAEPLDRAAAVRIAQALDREPDSILEPLLEAAQELGVRGHGREITVSRNVFIPLTNLCRNRCGYCTFAVRPDSPQAKTYRLDEVRRTARDACRAGCAEALFCLGDKPEVAYRGYRGWLDEGGYASTAEYLVEACRVAFEQGVFPHTNAGVLSGAEMQALRPFNASLGLMLETTSRRLRGRGQAHYYAPDKEPARRLRMTREAGELKIPFTSGILIGIGETPEERVDTLLAIGELQAQGGHIQEVIVQNFHPKPDTPMADVPQPSDALMGGTVALARLLLGPAMNLQAPPNLSPTSLELLVRSGLNDWGGVSPLTIDFINPEAPWPELELLRRRTEAAGYRLRDRLCVYPEFVTDRPDFFEPRMYRALRAATDAGGYPPSGSEVEHEPGRIPAA
ncbi:MAG: 7,8-didemethyl-8-hydroxy-5-deazariboflavin synthase CofG [Proteobacteria bacterium]|nr:7,8-didemethyl-8-hydroxy-5-deazariboflavin synthase CofG [Pseudomonadota bacterium]